MTMWPLRATIGRPALRCVCKRRRASMIGRRHFLIGAGALLTASFVNRAKAFSRKSGEPLVLSPARKPEETLYVYRQEIWSDYGGEWRVSLGPDQPFAPPPPTWREHLRALGHPLDTDDEIERACMEHDLPLDELDVHLNGFGWEDSWDNFTGPQAKAHHLLMRGHQMSTPFDPDNVGWSDTPRWPRAVRRSALMRQGRDTGGA